IPTYVSCKNPSTRFLFPYLSSIPEEISSVPLYLRMYLSPVYLHCSLERTPNSNPYSEYRSLVGTMNYSQNMRAYALYSGILGAFLEPTNNNTNDLLTNSLHNKAL
ncbi:5986_t:CDS:1, partial [Gigaspora rosea]